ncbi:trehalose synthase [Salegentibacter salinarum]|uniref:Alpha-amylase n=1 Tax=Salegentibacter salinarum TaxID=447422 RepID=A0A2N0TNF6_9FLAO|nr:alpha-amylase family protein [Salegentibacter salinarum]PKD16228.1 trehalose synthase [Salegentibacter salinarum]SKB67718.1 maltose alpha-D-glucosyltransferase/ alpha-amylase [Salegentibacter salinarum]
MNKYWYKNAVIYCLDVETFKDSNNDGVGDFKGLKNALTYLSSLGITCLWLMPFFGTPDEDNGYDVRNYYEVDPRLGDLGNFTELLDAASEVGIRVLIDLPVNHTSEQHFWFQEARKGKKNKYHNFYIWQDEKPKDDGENIMAENGEGSNWKYDRKAKAWYYHTFFPHQPDLNISNPDVQKEIFRIMHFWLKLGVSGFRMDAAPHMFTEKGQVDFQEDPHEIFRNFREFVETQKPDAILLAEVDIEPENYQNFFGDEDQMHMLFNFYVNNYLFLSLAREEATPVAKALKEMAQTQEKEQMAMFIRNHDELNLDRLSEKERTEVIKAFAPNENMQMLGGIRRRVASMLNNDRKRIELAYSLLFTLPGTPVLRYGQEIGMGEDLNLDGRDSVRTLMQWSSAKNGGFSDAAKKKLVTNLVSKGEFGYKKVNVNDQHRTKESLLNWMTSAIRFRKEFPEFGWGNYKVLDVDDKRVLAVYRKSQKGLALSFHNFSNEEITVKIDIEDPEDIEDIFGDERYEGFNPSEQKVKLNAYGYRWMHKSTNFV